MTRNLVLGDVFRLVVRKYSHYQEPQYGPWMLVIKEPFPYSANKKEWIKTIVFNLDSCKKHEYVYDPSKDLEHIEISDE